jgi:hypothetical protein
MYDYTHTVYMHRVEAVKKGKGKVIPLQAYGAQRVLGRLRLPDSVTSALESRSGRIRKSTHYGDWHLITQN